MTSFSINTPSMQLLEREGPITTAFCQLPLREVCTISNQFRWWRSQNEHDPQWSGNRVVSTK